MDASLDTKIFEFVSELASDLSASKLSLPAFPDVVIRIRDVLDDPLCSLDKVARVAGAEPVLTATLLKLANSALMKRGSGRVEDLRTAISRLGLDCVRNGAVAIATRQLVRSERGEPLRTHLRALWQHSVQVAALSYLLAKKQTHLNPDEAMLAGLLHDIGKIYIYLRAKSHPELFADEETFEELVQEWHPGVGRAILEAWDFTGPLLDVAAEHEVLDRDHTGRADLVDVVHAANVHAHIDDNPGHRIAELTQQSTWGRLGLTLETSVELMVESKKELRAIHATLGG